MLVFACKYEAEYQNICEQGIYCNYPIAYGCIFFLEDELWFQWTSFLFAISYGPQPILHVIRYSKCPKYTTKTLMYGCGMLCSLVVFRSLKEKKVNDTSDE